MPEANPIEKLQQHLVKLGCPAKAMRRIVRETADHYEDLQQAALARGLSKADAIRQAQEQLGDPLKLAEQHVAVLRNTFDWNLLPLLGFAVLPYIFWVGCPFLTFLAALFGFELAWRSPKCSWWIILLACVATSLETFLIPTMALNVMTPWLVAGLIYVGRRRPRTLPSVSQA